MSIIESWRVAKARSSMIALALLLAACAGIPYQEMSDARQAIESARPVVSEQTEAGDRPALLLRRARDLLERAEHHLRAGDYGRARALAERAKATAIEARERAGGPSSDAEGG